MRHRKMRGSMTSAFRAPLPLLSRRHMEPVPTAVGNPWGLELTELGFQAGGGVKVNRYLYNGNKIIRDLNLELYDFKARFYDPVIGRFLSVDPLSADERQVLYSPYQFGWNNPVRFNDPNGECPECEEKRANPFKGEIYRSTGGADYVFGKGAWTRAGRHPE